MLTREAIEGIQLIWDAVEPGREPQLLFYLVLTSDGHVKRMGSLESGELGDMIVGQTTEPLFFNFREKISAELLERTGVYGPEPSPDKTVHSLQLLLRARDGQESRFAFSWVAMEGGPPRELLDLATLGERLTDPWLAGLQIAALSQAIARESDQAAHYRRRAACHIRKADYAAALADCNQALQLQPEDAEALFRRGLCQMRMGELQVGLTDMQASIRLNPNEPASYQMRGRALAEVGQYEGALADFSQVVTLLPQYGRGYLDRAYAYLALKRQEEAERDFVEAIKLDPQLKARIPSAEAPR